MRADDLIKPVTPDAPCGDDLLTADDSDFIDYYFNVEDRLPAAYYNIARGTLFDPKTVDHKSETGQIDALLKRTRDLRLMVLEAKFQILAGRFKGFADQVIAMADLLVQWPGDLHPTDPVERQNALEELNALHTVCSPLEYAVLLSDRRIGDILYRPYGIATGKIDAREGESAGDSTAIIAALGNADNAKAVDALFAQIDGLRDAFERIDAQCQAGPRPFTPKLTRLKDRLGDMRAMVLQARTDLSGEAPADAPPGEDTGETGQAPAVAGQTAVIAMAATAIPDHHAAYRHLQAVERYFALHEPASLALVLVTQSRLLIGRPLVEALDALLENSAGRASIDFGSDTGFSISMSRMRQLSNDAGIAPQESWGVDSDTPAAPEVVSRDHAGQMLKTLEDFFRAREPASPIPILLFKARGMLSKDFQSLVRELIPPSGYR